MSELLHIVDRALIHFFSAGGLLLWVWFGLRALGRRKAGWVPGTVTWQLVLAALLVLLVAVAREPIDVWQGGWVGKSYADMASWVLGLTMAFAIIKRAVRLDWN